jgi:hypothetical protein
MSFSSYNVKINNVATPYISACSELGWFGNSNQNSTSICNANWTTMACNLSTNNGIAYVTNAQTYSTGLKFNYAGIYKITLSVDVYALNASQKNESVYFAFGLNGLNSSTTTSLFLGGQNGVYLKNIGFGNNTSSPGIIYWNTNAYCSTNSTPSGQAISNNYLYYNYNTATTNIQSSTTGYYIVEPGICTTEIIFIVSDTAQEPLVFNIGCATGVSVEMGSSYFILELLSTNIFPEPPIISTISPTTGNNTTLVTITGTNLNNNLMHVYFGNNSATIVSSSSTTITCYPPSKNPGTIVTVTVVTNGGTSNGVSFTYIPTITSISPTSGTNGTIITVTGGNFVDGAYVYIQYNVNISGGPYLESTTAQPAQGYTSTQLEFTMPSLQSGAYNVTISVIANNEKSNRI